MITESVGFQTEAELANCYSQITQEAINRLKLNIRTRHEVPAPGGIPDLVIFNEVNEALHYVIAIEFKLSNWRKALHQAFRYRNFGNETYVVLDYAKSRAAVHNLESFRRANVGLITIDSDRNIKTWHMPNPGLPFSIEYSQIVAHTLVTPSHPSLVDHLFIKNICNNTALSSLKTVMAGESAII